MAQRLRGDVNNDGNIGTLDATYILSYKAGLSGYDIPAGTIDYTAADADNDGNVGTLDATYILSYKAGLSGYETFDPMPSVGGDFMMRVDENNNVQTKIPADHKLVGFLASFTGSNISYNTSTLNNVITGNHKVSHAVATDEGRIGTGGWETVFTLNSTATLDTSDTENAITGTPETHLAVVATSAPHTILTKHTKNSSDFF